MALAGSNILSLDVGEKRIGVAIASTVALIPRALSTISRSETSIQEIKDIATAEDVKIIIVGLPRSMNGQETEQTRRSQAFAQEITATSPFKVYFQDEALTSVLAEQELIANKKPYSKGDIDALAAVYILQDFLTEQREI